MSLGAGCGTARFSLKALQIGSKCPRARSGSPALGHPVYDCLYIALAARDAAPLITADKALQRRVRGTVWQDLQFLGDALDA